MKNLIALFIFCFSILTSAQDKFNESITQLAVDFEYYPITKNQDKNYINHSLIAESFKKSKTYCSKYDTKINELNFNEFVSAKSTEIKSKKPLKGKTYLSVRIEEWTFNSIKNAEDFSNKFQLVDLECLNKGGIEFWRIDKKIYIINSPAKLFSYEFDKIKDSMNKKLN